MAIAKSILEEELENLKRQLDRASKEYATFPRGSLRMKNINGKDYPYLQYKSNGKVVSVAVKKTENLAALKMELEKRDKIKLKVRQLKVEIQQIEKSLKSLRLE